MSAVRHPLRNIWVLMATVFVDMIGFFIVLPLLPFYAEKLGASAVEVGALVSTFALAQLLTAPVWGRLSDRYGRRPIILAGLLIAALAFVVFEVASAVWLLFLSRFVQGAGSGTTAVVQAYVADSVSREDRAKAIGWLTAATSAGVMLGPVIGSVFAGERLGPGYLAALLCVVNCAFAWRWLPESSGRERRARDKGKSRPGDMRRTIGEFVLRPRGPVASMVWVYALGMMAFMAMNGIFALYLERVFGVDEKSIGWFFFYVGGVSLIMRSIILGPAVRWLGEQRAMRVGALSVTAGMAAVPFARTIPELGLAVLLIPVGTALLFPTTTSLVSQRAPEHQTGLYLGVQQTFGGISRLIGPIWAGVAFQYISIRSPFWLAAGVMAAGRLFAGGLKESAETPSDGAPTEPR